MYFPVVALVGRYQDSILHAPLKTLAQAIEKTDRKIIIEAETARYTRLDEFRTAEWQELGNAASLAVVMGGDGTVLGTARQLAPYGIPLIGINHGRTGFITDIPLQDAQKKLCEIFNGKYKEENRMLLQVSVWRDSKQVYSSSALNDVVINQPVCCGMVELSLELDGAFMYMQRADGLIISTPTGSTAYNLAVNGPVVYPSLDSLLVAPIAPQTLSSRPVVLPESSTLGLKLVNISPVEVAASVHADMRTWSELQLGDYIIVRRAPYKVSFVHPENYSFFSTLRQKLYWNATPYKPESAN